MTVPRTDPPAACRGKRRPRPEISSSQIALKAADYKRFKSSPPGPRIAEVGAPAPQFTLPAVLADGTLSTVSLRQYVDRYLVILFYPFDFAPFSQHLLVEFDSAFARFQDIGCDIVFCSQDSEYVHFRWRSVPKDSGGLGPVSVPMLADRAHQVSALYSVCREPQTVQLAVIDRAQVLRAADVFTGTSDATLVDKMLDMVASFKCSDKQGESFFCEQDPRHHPK
ncbi:Peroxiredoxin [Coemansia sp. Benny D115]|nr:Peroxiredoxin [Coemansia sp. Benny D115]